MLIIYLINKNQKILFEIFEFGRSEWTEKQDPGLI